MEINHNRIKMSTNIVLTIILGILAFLCVVPYLLSISISITSADQIKNMGYSIIPKDISFLAYKYLFSSGGQILHAYFITIVVTLLGTLLVLFCTITLGYVISRKDFRYRNSLTFFIFFTMIFNAGLTANYMVMTNVLHAKDTIWALILPLLINPFWIFMARTYFIITVPDEVIESARIDGASEFKILGRIVIPISLPVIATIGLFSTLTYWNDWFNAKLYIESESLVTLQYYLVRIQENVNYLIKNAAAMGTAAADASAFPQDSMMMAIMIVSTLPLAIAYPFFQKYFVSGLTIGAIK